MNNNVFIVTIAESNPETLVQEYHDKLSGMAESVLFLWVKYPFEQYWLPDDSSLSDNDLPAYDGIVSEDTTRCSRKPVIELSALYCLSLNGDERHIRVAVSADASLFARFLHECQGRASEDGFVAICKQLQLPYFTANHLFEVEPISIPKPWGQEIWYTGIEERGVACFTAQGFSAPIPWVLSTLPTVFCGNSQKDLILLKILDPYSDPAFGDLYFELHQEKREVYVVTGIDPVAWPSGKGAIRFGFNQEKRKQYSSDASFRTGFLEAVNDYEDIRRKIDDCIDSFRRRDDIGENQLVDNGIANTWLNEVPAVLKIQERQLGRVVEEFTDKLCLSVGDVVKVPCLTPHSLQHGVRTIEFQTPVYERLIVSFNQKVQTQLHWDTKKAIEVMSLESAPQSKALNVAAERGVKREKIVEFEDFDVIRIEVESGSEHVLADIDRYCLIICITGNISINSDSLAPERASLLTVAMNGTKIIPILDDSACFLIAYPK